MSLPPEFAIERFFDEHEFSGVDLLCCSDCETMTVGELLRLEPEARDELARLPLGYTQAPGDPELRELIAGLYTPEARIDADSVMVHASGVEPIHNLFRVVLDRGDPVVVQTPAYGAAPGVAQWIGARVLDWPLRELPSWHVDLSLLADHLGSGAKLVYLNTPHNPTGWQATRAELDEIVSLCDRHGAILLVDEAYRESEYDAESRLPGGCGLGPHVVSLGVLSKSYGLAGLRLGWLATTNPRMQRELAAVKDYTSICTSAPSELLAKVALRQRERILDRTVRLIVDNRAAVDRLVRDRADAMSWSPPMAGPVGFVRLRGVSAHAFCERARREAGVLLLPSTTYDWGDGHFRVGFGRADCTGALQRLGDWMISHAPV